MEPVHPEFIPDGGLSRDRMREMQVQVAQAAVFRDDPPRDPARVDDWVVAGVDQAFVGDQAVSAVVVRRADRTVERAHAVAPLTTPYVPGYLSFREGGPIVEALRAVSVEPDLLVFDGSGRIHFRQAGLATHIGVVFDVPTIGVAKGLLCGTPAGPTEGLAAGETVPVEADDDVDAPAGTVIGHAVQTRQFAGSDRHVNPVYVSPGHRVGPETAAAVVLGLTAGYKLPEPVRLADDHAAQLKSSLVDDGR